MITRLSGLTVCELEVPPTHNIDEKHQITGTHERTDSLSNFPFCSTLSFCCKRGAGGLPDNLRDGTKLP